ncbi:MAG: hypothetical protein DRP11_03210 [Candidatus Aenigmatarchaeota archaeon]|nr:MAG: hypothetical protein DRP11_03210 [Candidatus Aenigmarchaeota archaeon]
MAGDKAVTVPRKLLYLILFFVVIGAISFTLDYLNIRFELPEDLTPPRGGFYRGFVGEGVLFFATYYHPQYQELPLTKYSTLHSNTFTLYAFSFSTRDVTLEVVTYLVRNETRTIKEGNTTRTVSILVPYDERAVKVPIHVIGGSFSKVEVELPTSLRLREAEIRLNGRVLFRFKHETWKAFLPAPRYTLGTLFLDRMAYMAGTTLVCLFAFAVAKATINRVKYVPEMPRWIIAILPTLLIILGAFGAFYVVYYYALLEAAYTFIPIFVLAWIFGLYLVRPKPIIWYLSRIVNTEQPTKRLEMIEVIQDENRFWTMQGWRDFLRGRKREVTLVGNEKDDPAWWFNIEGSNDRFILYDDVLENEDRIAIKVAPLHEKSVEEWQVGLLEVKSLAEAYEKTKKDLYRVKAEAKKEAIEEGSKMAEQYVDKLLKAIGLKEKEADKHEQTGQPES